MAIGYPNLKKEKLEMPDKKENQQTKSCRLVLSSEGLVAQNRIYMYW